MKDKKRPKRRKNPDMPHSFSSCLSPLDGRTPTPGRRPTYTLTTHKTSKKIEKEKRKKKLKRIKYLGVLCTFSLSSFSPLDFVFSSIGAANIHRITQANVKWAGDEGDQSTRDGDCASLLSLFPTSFSLLLAQLISTESRERTSNGRATTGVS